MGEYRELDDMLKAVAEGRARVKAAEYALKDAEDAMLMSDAGAEYRYAQANLAAEKAALASAEQLARTSIVEIYDETGDKHPSEGAKVNIYHTPDYSVDTATEWCRTNAPTLLALDKKAFEKANLPGAPIRWKDDPRAIVASDLGGYLDEG